ncbi:MAG: response regulator transcription factor [Gammaproteobacteria bacterium]|nr:response regulator transcription factor [Gammaproteobacteria bacterium]
MRLLLVEDELDLRESLQEKLRQQGFVVDTAKDGEEGLYFATEYPVDLAIVDLGLPGISGMDLIRQARERGAKMPILVLTARDRWQDKVEALQAGADDYVVKPFSVEELLARVQALLRRTGGWSDPVLVSGPVSLDTRSQKVKVAERELDLTSFEYRLLECLLLAAGKVMSKADLTERLYEQDFERDSNTIEVFISRLRVKLDPDGTLNPIETKRGRGYRWALDRS